MNEFEFAWTLKIEGAYPLEDLFDFENSPSLNTTLTQAAPPAKDPIGQLIFEDVGIEKKNRNKDSDDDKQSANWAFLREKRRKGRFGRWKIRFAIAAGRRLQRANPAAGIADLRI